MITEAVRFCPVFTVLGGIGLPESDRYFRYVWSSFLWLLKL